MTANHRMMTGKRSETSLDVLLGPYNLFYQPKVTSLRPEVTGICRFKKIEFTVSELLPPEGGGSKSGRGQITALGGDDRTKFGGMTEIQDVYKPTKFHPDRGKNGFMENF